MRNIDLLPIPSAISEKKTKGGGVSLRRIKRGKNKKVKEKTKKTRKTPVQPSRVFSGAANGEQERPQRQ